MQSSVELTDGLWDDNQIRYFSVFEKGNGYMALDREITVDEARL